MGTRKRTTRPALTPGERAVYELAAAGKLRPEHAGVYRRELRALAGAGLIGRGEAGSFITTRPPPPPQRRTRLTLALTADTLALVDTAAKTWGVSRKQAAERILSSARLGGQRRSDPPAASGERLAVGLLNTIVSL